MPTYEYECQSCGKTLEIFQSMKDNPERKCPECGAMSLRRLPGGGAGFIFKGSGFYITDYRSDDYKKRAKAEGEKGGTSTAAESGASGGEGGSGGKDAKKPDGGAKSDTSAAKTASGS